MNSMRVALDMSILVYAEGLNGDAKKQSSLEVVQKLPQDFFDVMAIGECASETPPRQPAGRQRSICARRLSFWACDGADESSDLTAGAGAGATKMQKGAHRSRHRTGSTARLCGFVMTTG